MAFVAALLSCHKVTKLRLSTLLREDIEDGVKPCMYAALEMQWQERSSAQDAGSFLLYV